MGFFLLLDFIVLQIMEEIEMAKERYGKLNTIVMNAVVEACVHCGDIDSALMVFDEMSDPGSCGVDTVTYGTLLKVLFLSSSFFKIIFFIASHGFVISDLGALLKGFGQGSKN